MMNDKPPRFTITCNGCGESVPTGLWSWRHSCGGTLQLDIAVDAARVDSCCVAEDTRLSRFAPVLPLEHAPETAIGDTPLLIEVIDGVQVCFKLEYLNPGGSFKDRGAYVTVVRCAELGFKSIVVDSSGNAGIAIALMGLRLGIQVDVFLPRSTPDGKRQLLRLLHARLHEVDGDRMQVQRETLSYAATGAAYAGHWWNPYFAHGVKTMAYEALHQIPDVDCVFSPVGAGTVLLGLNTGYSELATAGITPSAPKLVAVQAAGYSPVALDLGAADVSAAPSRLADGIAIANPPRRREIADAVTRSGGFGMVVSDAEIASALRWLLARGYLVEPTSAVPLAGLMRCIREGRVRPGQRILLPLTGTGLKVLDELPHITDGAFGS